MKTFKVFFFGFVFLFSFSGVSYSGWFATQTVLAKENLVEFSSQSPEVQLVSAPEGGRLVPVGCAWDPRDVEEAIYVYGLFLDEGVLPDVIATASLTRGDGTRVLGVDHLVHVDVSIEQTAPNYVQITVRVSLSEPADALEYELLAGSQIHLSVGARPRVEE